MKYNQYASFFLREGVEYLRDEPMSRHTSFKIGGKAAYYIKPKTREQVIRCVDGIKKHGDKFYICGNLTNVVFADEGYDGVVIDLRGMNEITFTARQVTCGAGASLNLLSIYCSRKRLSGFEFAYGIPGTVGGAVCMNAGAFGGQMSDVVETVCAYDTEKSEITVLDRRDCSFGYRQSVFSGGRYVILSAVFRMNSGGQQIQNTMREYMKKRISGQPLNLPNAGSIFKRPEGFYVGSMIEELGMKGLREGGIAVSEKHAGFMVNLGGGTCAQLRTLIDTVKRRVKEAYGVELCCEIRFVE